MSTRCEALVNPTALAQPAPLSGWRRLLGDWIVVSGATVLCQVLGSATSLLLRGALSPAQMGVWQALKLLLTNGNYANLGISKGAARELSLAVGRGDPASVQRDLDLAFTVNSATSVVYALALLAAGLGIGWFGQGPWATAWAIGLAAVGGLSILQRYVTFQVTLLRAKQDFTVTSQLSILEAVLTLAVVCAATWFWRLTGLYLGMAAVFVGSIIFVHRGGAFPLSWAWDAREIRRLIAIGSPMLMAGTISTVFRTLDKLMILGYLSDREFQLGCYSLALMVTGQLYGIGNMLSIVIGPRLGERYGHSRSLRDTAGLMVRSSELLAAAITLPSALAMVAVPPLLAALLPAYQSGLVPMLWLIPGTIALCLALPPSQYLMSVDRQNWSLAAIVLATAAAALGNHLALRGGWGLVGVAAATSASYMIYFALVAVPVCRDLDFSGRLRYLLFHGLAVGPTMLVAGSLEWLPLGQHGDWTMTAAKIAAVILTWSLTLTAGWHLGGWREALSPEL